MTTTSAAIELALQHHREGRLDAAEQIYRQVLEAEPNHAGALELFGVAAAQSGKREAAVHYLTRAIQSNPHVPEYHNNLAFVLKELKRFDQSEASYRRALELNPQYAEVHNDLGIVLRDQERPEAAVASIRRALELKPDFANAHHNLGTALLDQGEYDAAINCFRKALSLDPNCAEIHHSLGLALSKQRQTDEAMACYERALVLRPNFATAHCARAMALLQAGKFAQAWPEFEWHRQVDGAPLPRPFKQPRWQGEPIAGKTILLHAEWGLGDTLQFIRYAPLVKAWGARTVVECQPGLQTLLSRCPGIDSVVPAGGALPEFDVYASLLSLPGILQTTLETIPADVPYLFADPQLVERWRGPLAKIPGFKVGIAWQGSRTIPWADRLRSIPLHLFEPLARCAGVSLINLQKNVGIEQLRNLAGRFPVTDLGSGMDGAGGAFVDTAAIMKHLDLVITADTAIAHVAGALGVPVWVAMPFAGCWRWLLDRDDSPWYPSMRLFRQTSPGDWQGVFQRMTRALEGRGGGIPVAAAVPTTIEPATLIQATPAIQSNTAQPPTWSHANDTLGFASIHEALSSALQQHQAGRFQVAAEIYQRVLAREPRHPGAWHLLGVATAQSGQLETAVSHYRRALELAPEFAEAHSNLGNALKDLAQHEAAEACYQRALRIKPDFADAHSNLGNLLRDLGREDDAVASYRRALEFRPEFADALNNLGSALRDQGKYDEALASYRRALQIAPRSAIIHYNLGEALQRLNQLEAALASYRQALEISPDFASAHFNCALTLLHAGEFAQGWREFEWRRQVEGAPPPRPFKQSPWRGEPIAGKAILLHAEWGLGDTLQFIRYVPLVKKFGARTIVECQPGLQALLSRCPGIDSLVASGNPLPDFDAYASLLSLPGILGTTLTTIPADVPYLFADPQLAELWRGQLANIPGLKVGVAWQGSVTLPKEDRLRSIPLAFYEPLARCPGVSLISLQKGFGTEQLQNLGGRFSVTDLGSGVDGSGVDGSGGAFVDTAAIMKHLDLVITADTAIAHVAGGLGVPVWVAVPFAGCWRWLRNRDDSPWYSTMRLFRQTSPGDWQGIFQRMAVALQKFKSGA